MFQPLLGGRRLEFELYIFSLSVISHLATVHLSQLRFATNTSSAAGGIVDLICREGVSIRIFCRGLALVFLTRVRPCKLGLWVGQTTFQSILLVVCDTPFNVHSYNIVDMGGNAERPHFYLGDGDAQPGCPLQSPAPHDCSSAQEPMHDHFHAGTTGLQWHSAFAC